MLRAPRFFASSLVFPLFVGLAGCSLVLDTDPADPQVIADLGLADTGTGALDLGAVDLGSRDGNVETPDLGELDGSVPDCLNDDQCDDFVVCNGSERCIGGSCVTEPVVCPDVDGIECTLPTCDSSLDACTEVAQDAACAAREYCDATDGCVRRPDCIRDDECPAPDACTVGSCDPVTRSCSFATLDCAALLPPLGTGDCRVPSCDLATGCFFAPVDRRCDDGIECTADRCLADGRCVAELSAARCDDGAACTVDVCDPSALCSEPSGASGCKHVPDNIACTEYAADVSSRFVGLACAQPVCLGAGARNPAGCGFEGGCSAGERCDEGSGIGPPMCIPRGRGCLNDEDCSDSNPCNGAERCEGGVCVAPLTDVCRPTPSGPTLLGTCAFASDAPGGMTPFCAPSLAPCASP